jgi:ATP synthase protein I
VTKSSDDRSPLVQAMDWATQITGLAMQMVVPAIIGYWLDLKLGTKFVLLILGMVLGFITGMRQLIRWSHASNRRRGNSEKV